MNKNLVIAGWLIVVLLLAGILLKGSNFLGASSGPEHYNAEYFYNGLTSSGATVLSGTNTLSGAATLSGTNTLSGATTITGTAAVSQTTSSTLKIGYAATGLLHGCLVLGDSGGATSTPVYITATGETISATTTKPAICK